MSNRARLGFGRVVFCVCVCGGGFFFFFFARSLALFSPLSSAADPLTSRARHRRVSEKGGGRRRGMRRDRGRPPPPPRRLGSPPSPPGSAPAPSTSGLRGVPAIPVPVRGPGCGFARGGGDARPPTPHTLRCLAWRPVGRFPGAARTRRGRASPSGRCREAFSTRHLALSQVATAQGREGETPGPGRGPPPPPGDGEAARNPWPWARRAPLPGGRGGAAAASCPRAPGRARRGLARCHGKQGHRRVCAGSRAHSRPPRVSAGRRGAGAAAG